jgi:hypothetical protein
MIIRRNQAQCEANERHEQQNPKRNAASVSNRNNNEDGTLGAMTIRSVQFDDDEDTGAGGASSLFGATGRKKRNVGAVVCIGKAIKIGKPNNFLLRAHAKIDTRADTVCTGSTFKLYKSTGKVVDVSGFHKQLEAIKNIQVGTCITAMDLENKTIIASFPQSLYFGDTMETSLIPPAQF